MVENAFAGAGFRAAQWRVCESVQEDEGLATVTSGRKLIDRNLVLVEEKLSTATLVEAAASPKANKPHPGHDSLF